MAENTGIEWADHTFNPWVGCTKVSPACDHCYAEEWDKRFKGGVHWGPHAHRARTSSANWRQPLKWDAAAKAAGRPAFVFCASLADVFDNAASTRDRDDLWHLIHKTPHLIWLLLTKRPQNIAKMLPDPRIGVPEWGDGWPHVWFGTTVENQAEADRRIPHLLSVPAAKRFLSCEPLLGPVDLTAIPRSQAEGFMRPLDGRFNRIDWVIAGGESGREARPSHPDWFRSLRDQCAGAGVPFLFKQWGEWCAGEVFSVDDDGRRTGGHARHQDPHASSFGGIISHWWSGDCWGGTISTRCGKKAAGRTLDGVIHDGRPAA